MYDPKMAARVWERVQANSPAPDLSAILRDALVLAQAYGQLSAKLPKHRKSLLTLRQELLTIAQELNGLLYLEQGTRLPLKPPASAPALNLSQCCQRELDWAAACGARRQDPRFGPLYAQWEAQSQRHCQTVLALLGNP